MVGGISSAGHGHCVRSADDRSREDRSINPLPDRVVPAANRNQNHKHRGNRPPCHVRRSRKPNQTGNFLGIEGIEHDDCCEPNLRPVCPYSVRYLTTSSNRTPSFFPTASTSSFFLVSNGAERRPTPSHGGAPRGPIPFQTRLLKFVAR